MLCHGSVLASPRLAPRAFAKPHSEKRCTSTGKEKRTPREAGDGEVIHAAGGLQGLPGSIDPKPTVVPNDKTPPGCRPNIDPMLLRMPLPLPLPGQTCGKAHYVTVAMCHGAMRDAQVALTTATVPRLCVCARWCNHPRRCNVCSSRLRHTKDESSSTSDLPISSHTYYARFTPKWYPRRCRPCCLPEDFPHSHPVHVRAAL